MIQLMTMGILLLFPLLQKKRKTDLREYVSECARYQVSAVALYNAALSTIGSLDWRRTILLTRVSTEGKKLNLEKGRKRSRNMKIKMDFHVLDLMENETRRQG